jgi:hypothetical protein
MAVHANVIKKMEDDKLYICFEFRHVSPTRIQPLWNDMRMWVEAHHGRLGNLEHGCRTLTEIPVDSRILATQFLGMGKHISPVYWHLERVSSSVE